MRLGTLARKISITPSKLTSYLESQSITLASGTNTKLTEDQIELILEHFQATLVEEPVEVVEPVREIELPTAEVEVEQEPVVDVEEETVEPSEIPELKEDSIQEQVSTEEQDSIEEEDEKEETSVFTPHISESFAEIALPHELDDQIPPPGVTDEIKEIEKKSATEETSDVEPQAEESQPKKESKTPIEIDPDIESDVERAAYDDSIEVIKPPKVVLPGLKVKGKIELPEPKAPSDTSEEPKEEVKKPHNPDEIITTTGPRRDRKRKPKNYKGKKYEKDYNPVEAARRKKEWEEKKRLEQEEKRKKKAKEKHYKKIATPLAKPVSQKKKPKKAAVKKKQKEEQKSGNMMQRFWRWMNT
ncbi:MAG: hypothetical protein ABJF11_00665 [Reichenbachiella sp.]|uniref:hypothetical protein n=1 Tax=Reichenbachiella sp. TaxID=2184521 RepID=UPI00326600F3